MTTFNNTWTPFHFTNGKFKELSGESFVSLTIRTLLSGSFLIRFESREVGQYYAVECDDLFNRFTGQGKCVCWLREIVEGLRLKLVSMGAREESIYDWSIRGLFVQLDAFTIFFGNNSSELEK